MDKDPKKDIGDFSNLQPKIDKHSAELRQDVDNIYDSMRSDLIGDLNREGGFFFDPERPDEILKQIQFTIDTYMGSMIVALELASSSLNKPTRSGIETPSPSLGGAAWLDTVISIRGLDMKFLQNRIISDSWAMDAIGKAQKDFDKKMARIKSKLAHPEILRKLKVAAQEVREKTNRNSKQKE